MGKGPFKYFKFFEYISEDINKFGFNKTFYYIILTYPVFLIIISYYWMIMNYSQSYMDIILQENHPVEVITFVVLLAAVYIGLKFIFSMYRFGENKYKIVILILFTLGLLFVALEEISWGQWFFKFESTDYFKAANLQKETNIHNIRELHLAFEYIRALVGLVGLLSILLNNTKTFKYISSPLVLIVSFSVITVFSSIDVYNFYIQNERFLYQAGGFFWFIKFNMEMIELIISVSAFVFLWSNWQRLNKARLIHE